MINLLIRSPLSYKLDSYLHFYPIPDNVITSIIMPFMINTFTFISIITFRYSINLLHFGHVLIYFTTLAYSRY